MNIKKIELEKKGEEDGEKEEEKHSKERLCCVVLWMGALAECGFKQVDKQASKRRKKENNAKHKK